MLRLSVAELQENSGHPWNWDEERGVSARSSPDFLPGWRRSLGEMLGNEKFGKRYELFALYQDFIYPHHKQDAIKNLLIEDIKFICICSYIYLYMFK